MANINVLTDPNTFIIDDTYIWEAFAASLAGEANNITGTAFNDIIVSGAQNDTIRGEGGDDALFGSSLSDVIEGGSGNDLLDGGNHDDTLIGGTGNDTYVFEFSDFGDDVIRDDDGTLFVASTSFDSVTGAISNNGFVLTGTAVLAEGQTNVYTFDAEGDTYQLTWTGDLSNSSSSSDLLIQKEGNPSFLLDVTIENFVNGTFGIRLSDGAESTPAPAPTPSPSTTPEQPSQGPDNVVVNGSNDSESLSGDAGNDTLSGNGGADVLFGRAGNDSINGGGDADMINGNLGNDSVYGGQGSDTVQGGKDNDFVIGNQGNDTVFGDLGNDTVRGGADNDFVNGNTGNDFVLGDRGDDIVRGGKGDDTINGGAGNDSVFGDLGNDTLIGGAGSDLFGFNSGLDVIEDFVQGVDTIGIISIRAVSVQQVLANTSYVNGTAVVDFGERETLTLLGVAEGSLTEADFTII